ncbi:MAG: hypothetical protein LBT40_17550 [Deltaproteobacteria bacterium]|jgi:hypothetical protein|nr:hypothetical protein [Deltaproteobacteria bacterium]
MEKEPSQPDDLLVSTASEFPESLLLIGVSDFSKFLRAKSVYVDKTALIYRLVTESSRKILFGKTKTIWQISSYQHY